MNKYIGKKVKKKIINKYLYVIEKNKIKCNFRRKNKK